jgi:hypothetical protein
MFKMSFTFPDIFFDMIPLLANNVSAKVVLPIQKSINLFQKRNQVSFIYHDQREQGYKNFEYSRFDSAIEL